MKLDVDLNNTQLTRENADFVESLNSLLVHFDRLLTFIPDCINKSIAIQKMNISLDLIEDVIIIKNKKDLTT